MNKEDKTPVMPEPVENRFKGYTLDELRYRKAFILLQREFTKAKFGEMAHRLTDKNSSMYTGHDKRPSIFSAGSIMSRVFKGLDYIDYAMLGLSLFTTGKKIFSIFRRKH